MVNSLRIAAFLSILLTASHVRSQSSNVEQELQAGNRTSETNLEKAIEHLERAVQLNPDSANSHLALANAYRAAYREDIETDDEEEARANRRFIDRALEEYKAVVALDPSNTEAPNKLGSNYFQLHKLNEADLWLRQSLKVSPSEKEALYSLAVLDWTRSYQFRLGRRHDLHLTSGTPLIRNRSCAEVRSKNLEQVEEAITMLKRLSQMSDFRDVPYYVSLLYRERADIQCGDRASYNADLRSAEEWEQAACAARRRGARAAPYWPPAPPPPLYLRCLW